MKKKLVAFGAAVLVLVFASATAFAEGNAEVTLNKENEIEYTGNAGEASEGFYLGDAFTNMAPGETATQTILLKNDSSHTVSFFLKQDTLQTMEELNETSGGAYAVTLKVGSSLDTATTILDASAGGYDTNSSANINGLADITELSNYSFLAQLQPEESTNLYLTITLNGEGFDSTDISDYTNAVARLGFNFRAYYDDQGTPEVVTKVINQTVEVRTGDTTRIWIPLLILAAGIVLLVAGFKKRKAGK